MRPLLISLHDRPVQQVLYNVDGDLFFSCSDEGKILIYWTYPFELMGSIKVKTAIKSIDVTKDSSQIIHAGLHLGLSDVETGKKLFEIESSGSSRFNTVQFSEGDNMFFAIGEGPYKEMMLYDTRITGETGSAKGINKIGQVDESTTVSSACWGENNQCLYIGTESGDLQIFDVRNPKESFSGYKIHNDVVKQLRYSPDNVFLSTVSRDKTSCIWDPSNFAEPVSTFTSSHPLNTCAVSPDAERQHIVIAGGVSSRETALVADAGFELAFFNMIYENEIAYIKGHFGPVNSLDFHPSGKSVASGSEDGTIRIHEFDQEYFTSEFD